MTNLTLIKKEHRIMNWITILGIVIIGLGTLLTYYGSSLSSRKDKKEITDKIDSFNQHIEKVKTENITQSEKEEKISQIEEEFNSWAEQFEKNKEEHKVELDKNEVLIRERKVKLNNQWHEMYVNFFSSLTQMVNAVNKVNGNNFINFKENPKFPNNIYEASHEKYKVVLQFNENVYWFIWLKVKEPFSNDIIPSIELAVSNRPDYNVFSWGDLSIRMDLESKIYYVDTMGIFNKAGFNSEYQFNLKTNQMVEILKKAFEYQILLIEK